LAIGESIKRAFRREGRENEESEPKSSGFRSESVDLSEGHATAVSKPSIATHPNELQAKRTETRFENKYVERKEEKEDDGDDRKFISETRAEVDKAKQEHRAKDSAATKAFIKKLLGPGGSSKKSRSTGSNSRSARYDSGEDILGGIFGGGSTKSKPKYQTTIIKKNGSTITIREKVKDEPSSGSLFGGVESIFSGSSNGSKKKKDDDPLAGFGDFGASDFISIYALASSKKKGDNNSFITPFSGSSHKTGKKQSAAIMPGFQSMKITDLYPYSAKRSSRSNGPESFTFDVSDIFKQSGGSKGRKSNGIGGSFNYSNKKRAASSSNNNLPYFANTGQSNYDFFFNNKKSRKPKSLLDL